jgi:hypothetical protein
VVRHAAQSTHTVNSRWVKRRWAPCTQPVQSPQAGVPKGEGEFPARSYRQEHPRHVSVTHLPGAKRAGAAATGAATADELIADEGQRVQAGGELELDDELGGGVAAHPRAEHAVPGTPRRGDQATEHAATPAQRGNMPPCAWPSSTIEIVGESQSAQGGVPVAITVAAQMVQPQRLVRGGGREEGAACPAVLRRQAAGARRGAHIRVRVEILGLIIIELTEISLRVQIFPDPFSPSARRRPERLLHGGGPSGLPVRRPREGGHGLGVGLELRGEAALALPRARAPREQSAVRRR